MIRDHFRVMVVDLSTAKGSVTKLDGRDTVAGGSGLAALLFDKYGLPGKPWDDMDQPLIFAIGPLTGYFPLMSKTVCAFKSPYHNQYAESHAGGRSALALRFADYDALVIRGRASRLSALMIGSKHLVVKDVHYLQGRDVQSTGKLFRRFSKGAGHRSILRIGPAGENFSAYACINVDTYRHFGRLGAGSVMGSKNLKAIIIEGDSAFTLPEGKKYPSLFNEVYKKLTSTQMMSKYHDLGTPSNVMPLNALQALPCRNLQQTSDPAVEGITGERFADQSLLRNTACSGCPIGCIHIGFVREKFMSENHYLYRQVSYDHEPIFAAGSMLGVMNPFDVLGILDVTEKVGLDVMSAGVALAWATEAFQKGLISESESIVPLGFGKVDSYKEAMMHLGMASNDFYRTLAQGTKTAAAQYGGEDFACVLGQEMAGYATGETFFVSQALGLRHSHLDAAGYTYDQKSDSPDVKAAVDFLVKDERERVFLTCMVSCLFARGVYSSGILGECLGSVGYGKLAESMDSVSEDVQKLRWKVRFNTGYAPSAIDIPKRFKEITTWKGPLDIAHMERLKDRYQRVIENMGRGPRGESE